MTDLIENDHYLKIKKLFDGKKFDEIITYCQKLLEKNTDDKLALQNIATAYNMVGAYQDAILCSEKVLGMDSNDEFALKNKIFASEKLEMHDQVLICCNKILKNNCDNIDVLIAKGIAFNKTEKHEDAEEPKKHEDGEESEKHVHIKKLTMRNAKINLSLFGKQTEAIFLTLPDFKLRDIGKASGGTSFPKASAKIFDAIYGAVIKAVSKPGKLIPKSFEQLRETAEEFGKSAEKLGKELLKGLPSK